VCCVVSIVGADVVLTGVVCLYQGAVVLAGAADF